MAGTGSWLVNKIDIGIPLEVGGSYQGDLGELRLNGAKSTARVNAVNTTMFNVKFLKDFNNQNEEYTFRKQLEQLQYGVEFMPYLLETNQYVQEYNNHLVLIGSISIDREAGKLNHMVYEISFADLGHQSESIGYTQFRATNVQGRWSEWENNRHVAVAFPVGAMFHSDSPTGTLYGAWGGMDWRKSPSTHTISYQECLGIERIGIEVIQDGVQMFSPHGRVGAGLSISNGYFKMVWNDEGHPEYYRWNYVLEEWQNYHTSHPEYMWAGFTPDDGEGDTYYYSYNAIRSKIEIKTLTTEYIQVEQEFQFSDGTMTAIRYHMNRGKNSIQLQARIMNRHMDYFLPYHYLNPDYLTTYTVNDSTGVIDSTTDIDEDLVDSPQVFVTVKSAYGGGNFGYINPDRDIVKGTVKNNGNNVELSTRHSWNEEPMKWSQGVMYFQGTMNPDEKEDQAGYIVKAGSQVVHRSHVY